MKAVFTCDDVFDILTREPFPSGGAEDEFVESHLAVCHDCRHLAEAFRPAVGLFHESMSAGIDDELPMYRGRLKPIIDTLQQPPRTTVPPARNAFTMIVFVIAASVALVGSAVVATLAVNQQRVSGIGTVASSVQLRPNRDDTLLAALEIPTVCRSTTKSTNLVAAADIACCTKCHHGGSQVESTEKAILKSSAACAACHRGMINESLSAARHWPGPAIDYDRLRMYFLGSFQLIDVRLATGSPAAPVYLGSPSRRFDTIDEIVVVLLDSRFGASRSGDAATPMERWAWRAHSCVVKSESLPNAPCEADRQC
jgi:hypothetical protein